MVHNRDRAENFQNSLIVLESFENFPPDPYYEPLSWFMITYLSSLMTIVDSVMILSYYLVKTGLLLK